MDFKKKCEKKLLVGTFLTLTGILLFFWLKFNLIISWAFIIYGKILVIFSVRDYIRYKKLVKGVDSNKKHNLKKAINLLKTHLAKTIDLSYKKFAVLFCRFTVSQKL